MLKLLIVGHGRAGKDTALDYLETITYLRNAGTTSKYLTKYVAQELGLSEKEAYEQRHNPGMRDIWKRIGDNIRKDCPSLLIKEAFTYGDMTGGVRDILEIQAARNENLADLIIWIQNDRIPHDPTITFTEKECDIIIQNNWSIEEFHERLWRFVKCVGLHTRYDIPPRYVNSNGSFMTYELSDPLC